MFHTCTYTARVAICSGSGGTTPYPAAARSRNLAETAGAEYGTVKSSKVFDVVYQCSPTNRSFHVQRWLEPPATIGASRGQGVARTI